MMTKKEKLAFDTAVQERDEAIALLKAYKSLNSQYEKVSPDLLPPQSYGGVTKGYGYNTYTLSEQLRQTMPRIEEAIRPMWSECTRHGYGEPSRHTGSQNGRSLYSTKLLALKALRADFYREIVNVLSVLNKAIEDEEEVDAN